MAADKIQFHYIKSHHFKSFYANGAFGGVGPNGLINMAFYIDRTPIPQIIVHEVSENGILGKEVVSERTGKTGVVREIDCNIMIDVATAKRIRDWLDQHIKVLETLKSKEENSSPQ